MNPDLPLKIVVLHDPHSVGAVAGGFPTRGCWTVGVTADPEERVAPSVSYASYNPDLHMEAFRYAESLSQRWSPVQEFPPGYKTNDRLKAEINEFCEWLDKSGAYNEDEECSVLADGSSAWCCTNAARLIADKFEGRVVGYHTSDNPAVRGNNDGGHDFALVGPGERFLVDWKPKAFECVTDVFILDRENPQDAAQIAALYGDEAKWKDSSNIPFTERKPITIYHASKVTGKIPEGFTPGNLAPKGYVKVAEVDGRDLALALKLTSHRPYEGTVPQLQGRVIPWYAHPPDSLPGTLRIYGGVSALPGKGKGVGKELPNDVVTTAGVESSSRQTHEGDIAVMGDIAYVMPDAHTPDPKFIPIPFEEVAAMRVVEQAKKAAESASQYLPSSDEPSLDPTVSL